jgi:hypothetical protein
VTTCRMGWRPRAVPGMASEGVSFGAVGRDDGRMRCPRHRPRALPAIPFPPGRPPDALPGMASAGVPGDDLSRQGMRSCDGGRMPDSRMMAVRPQQSPG